MSSENLDKLSDVELHKKLIQNGLPNTPVTETTRPLLIRKLKKHLKNEKLKRRKSSSNYVYYSSDNTDDRRSSIDSHNQSPILPRPSINVNDNNNVFTSSRNSSIYYNHHLDNSFGNTSPVTSYRMYAPPAVLTSVFDNDCEQLSSASKFHTPMDLTNSYGSPSATPLCSSDGGVVNRLLSFRDTTIQKKISTKAAYAMHVPKSATKNYNAASRFALHDLTRFFKKSENNQYIIPQVLIAGLIIFLSIISIVYISKKFEQSSLEQTVINYKLCSQVDDNNNNNDDDATTRSMCIQSEMLSSAMLVNQMLFKHLNERATEFHCKNENLTSAAFNINDLKEALGSTTNMRNKLMAAIYLITQNPQWKIKIIGENVQTDLIESSKSSKSLEFLSFELMQPKLPLKCVVLKKIQKFFKIIASLILLSAAGLTIYYIVNMCRARQKERLLAADQFTKEIINELIYLNSQSENSEVIVNQLQEKLIPANKRSKLLPAWERALRMLEDGDSRVLFGLINRNGIEYRTIAWNSNAENKDLSTSKKWQSPAFDNSNKIANPPTPCLKIRHMFDTSEIDHPNLRRLIIEAIFEKVGSRCKICDIQLDTQTCCVYLRCASEMDAGIVHNEINGWWFDKRLISIKFLRLERYLNRFPKPSPEPIYFLTPNIVNTHKRS